MQQTWGHTFFSVPTARVGRLLEVYVPRAYKDYWPPQYYNSSAYLTCTQQKHYTSREILLSMLLTRRHKVAAPDHSIQHTPPAIVALPVSAVHLLRAYCCTRVLDANEGEFSSQMYLHSATCLNLVNAEFLVQAFFFRAVRVGKPFILLLRRY